MKSRWLAQTLILSSILNLALLALFFYFLVRKNPVSFAFSPAPPKVEHLISPPAKAAFLKKLKEVKYEHLISLLQDQRIVAHGFRLCDFALGALACYHDFDVERGLGRGPLPVKKWKLNDSDFFLFPHLTQADFETLIAFSESDRWPYTVKGLFKKLVREGIDRADPELIQFFCHTPHFVLLETLFARVATPIQRRSLLALALEGGWEPLDRFYLRQRKNSDFSQRARQIFLLEALDNRSPTAAALLVVIETDFALHQLDDARLLSLIELLPKNSPRVSQFARQVAASPRSDTVRNRVQLFFQE